MQNAAGRFSAPLDFPKVLPKSILGRFDQIPFVMEGTIYSHTLVRASPS